MNRILSRPISESDTECFGDKNDAVPKHFRHGESEDSPCLKFFCRNSGRKQVILSALQLHPAPGYAIKNNRKHAAADSDSRLQNNSKYEPSGEKT